MQALSDDQHIAAVAAKVDKLEAKVDDGFADVRAEFRAVRAELRAKIGGINRNIHAMWPTMILGFAGLSLAMILGFAGILLQHQL
jgi:hypothetical protein